MWRLVRNAVLVNAGIVCLMLLYGFLAHGTPLPWEWSEMENSFFGWMWAGAVATVASWIPWHKIKA